MDISDIQKAIRLTYEGKFKEAEELYLKLLENNRNEPMLLSAFGLFYVSLKKYDKAIYYLKHACDIKETYGTVSAYGFALFNNGEYEEAAKILEHALIFGDNIDIYNQLILSLFEIKDYKKAAEYSKKMIELYPEEQKSVSNQVKSLTQSGKLIEAEEICKNYLAKHPDSASLWFHLGLLKELIYCDDREAISCYTKSGELGNRNSDYNIAVAYQKLCEFDMAEKYYKKYLETFPHNITGETSLGMCYLTQKKFNEGYDLFFNRDTAAIRKFTNNLWAKGTPLDNEIIIICDQGFGDDIQFIRYLPFLKDKKLKIAVAKSLKELFKNNYPDYEYIDYNEIDKNIQTVRITDLAYILGINFDNIPFPEGYLKAEKADIKNNKFKLGLCWEAGAAGVRGMINRTINVKCFEPLFNMNNIQTYSFQYTDTFKGNEKYPQMINLAKDFTSFFDTAKALKAMDAVITVDTVIAHLAGALGIKTYLLLPYAADWRWFRTGDYKETKTPWYQSITVLQQNNPISWEYPFLYIVDELSRV